MLAVELLDESEQQAVTEEIRLMKENPHPFIVRVIDDFLDDFGHQCLVQELYSQGDFSQFLFERGAENQFEEQEVLRFLANIIMIVYHLNSCKIYHRDLKPENFLVRTD